MTTSDDSALTVLHPLLRVCRDSAEGYATALRDITDAELQRELEQYRTERLKLADQLAQRIRELRGDPDNSPTVPGALHRAWIDWKSGQAPNPSEAVLAEIERGEDLAVDAYRQALKDRDMDAASRQLVERQYERVQAAHDRMRQLRDRSNYARA